ncbi:MAG: FAD-dependent oxidoreductase [Deltaproteobacteria bacterium]|jgi:glycerol-3-phosphate dehydrogenase|nr:FAD-dependent oxidoreductase [Deltaproteobacteria bacterium]
MTHDRSRDRLGSLASRYDLAVVGAGIQGAAVAWEAASRGLRVVLVEAGDFGSGTSANSLKTIHGGVRCLQRLDFSAMREYARERRALLRIVPHLVAPLPCMIPTHRQLSKSKLFLGAGMLVYDFASRDRNFGIDPARRISRCGILSLAEWRELAPTLSDASINGGVRWYDAQVYNSERLVLAFVISARNAGADTLNYTAKTEYVIEQGRVRGLVVRDRASGQTREIGADCVVDCTGPWAVRDGLFRSSVGESGPRVLARGINLVTPRKLTDCALGARPLTGLDDSRRLLFIAPWREGTIVGTWYYSEPAEPGSLTLTEPELADCLRQVNSISPSFELRREDISLIHRGLLPANPPAPGGVEPRLWEHAQILDAESGAPEGLYWLQGVKLTNARAAAVQAVDRAARGLGKAVGASKTDRTPLYGGAIENYRLFEQDWRKRLGGRWPDETIDRLLRNYGSCLESILALIDGDAALGEPVPKSPNSLRAEIQFALDREMPVSLSDLILRRTDLGTLACPDRATIDYCADVMARHMGWDSSEKTSNISELLDCYTRSIEA